MKKLLLSLVGVLLLSPALMAQNKSKKAPKAAAMAGIDTNEISWISLDEVQQRMKTSPKKVYIDVYTPWCGWCKVMDKKTFSNKQVIKYINTNFYAVKLDAEQTDSIHFMGGHYGMDGRTNQFAVQLLRGSMSYPSTVIMEEQFQNPQVIPGYQEVKNMEAILKYLAQNVYKTTPWEEYMKAFKPSWE